jgi:HAE1 family hydrophobic/amphiphilic exporter-1
MTFLTRISLANRLIVGLVTLAIIIFGVLSIFALKQELLPWSPPRSRTPPKACRG